MSKITEIELNGRKYVDKEQLRALIKEHKKKAKEGTEPGFIERDSGKRLAAYMALNHLGAALTTDEEREAAMRRIMNSPKIIVHFDENGDAAFFRMWCRNSPLIKEFGIREGDSVPVFSTEYRDALVFKDGEMAKKQLQKIRALFPKFGERLKILSPGNMSREEWWGWSVLFFGEPKEMPDAAPEDETVESDT